MKTDTYLSDVDLSKRWGVARPTVWRWHREDKSFPRCVKLTAGCTRWRLSEIVTWETSKT
ncbi:helix-turn-helix transcriptional regulator [Roseibium sp. MMSF_3544]|uniref:helix-turn-helix transcriptional regulator n=1 Tax=unclassified Roseibium TaxID=2629323 RepID=UPI003531A86B